MPIQIPIESLKQKPRLAVPKKQTTTSISGFLKKDITFFSGGVSDKTKEEFYRELHLMLSTGIDMRMSLQIFKDEIKSKKTALIFNQIYDEIVQGSPLSGTLKHAKHFTKYEFANIRIGEESGTLTKVLFQLARYYKNKISQRRQLIGALSYPVLVLITSIGAVGFMLQVVVPMFEDVFKRFGSELPWLTKMIVALSEVISDYFFLVILFLASLLIVSWMYSEKDWYRNLSAKLQLSIPFFGQIIRSSQLSKFSSAMYLLISAKHPLVNSLAMVKDMIGFYPIEKSLESAEADLVRGLSLSHSLSTNSIFPKKMIALINMAEEVNRLDEVFAQLRDQYNDDVAYRSGLLSNVLEPILIIFIGTMVGFILIAMYLPLFSLSTSVG